MKTKADILNQMNEVIQYFIRHKDNEPETKFCSNVDKLINLQADLANGDNKSDEECTLPVVRLSLPTILQLFRNAKTMNYKEYSDWVKRRLGYEA